VAVPPRAGAADLLAWLAAWVVTFYAALILALPVAAVLGVKAPLPDGGCPQVACPGRHDLLQAGAEKRPLNRPLGRG
jgi:hypothetical protein